MRIIVIDDEPLVLKSLVTALTALGHTCSGYEDWPSAREEVLHSKYDVLFTDLNMPQISGYGVLEEIRKLDTGRQPRVVAITGDANAIQQNSAAADGFDDVLCKPYSLQQLVDVITKNT